MTLLKLRFGKLLALVCASVFLTTRLGLAHTPSDTFLSLTLEGAKITGQCDIALRDLQHALGIADRDIATTRPEDLRLRQQALALDAVARLSLSADDRLLTLRVTDFVQLVEHDAGAVLAASHLGIERSGLPIGKPAAFGVAVGLSLKPEEEGVDTAIETIRCGVLWPLI